VTGVGKGRPRLTAGGSTARVRQPAGHLGHFGPRDRRTASRCLRPRRSARRLARRYLTAELLAQLDAELLDRAAGGRHALLTERVISVNSLLDLAVDDLRPESLGPPSSVPRGLLFLHLREEDLPFCLAMSPAATDGPTHDGGARSRQLTGGVVDEKARNSGANSRPHRWVAYASRRTPRFPPMWMYVVTRPPSPLARASPSGRMNRVLARGRDHSWADESTVGSVPVPLRNHVGAPCPACWRRPSTAVTEVLEASPGADDSPSGS